MERLRALLHEQVNGGSLVSIAVPLQNPVMRWAGHLNDDPTFDEYLEEIRKFREEMDRREGQASSQSACSNTSSTPAT
jgi:hypothetical protein